MFVHVFIFHNDSLRKKSFLHGKVTVDLFLFQAKTFSAVSSLSAYFLFLSAFLINFFTPRQRNETNHCKTNNKKVLGLILILTVYYVHCISDGVGVKTIPWKGPGDPTIYYPSTVMASQALK